MSTHPAFETLALFWCQKYKEQLEVGKERKLGEFSSKAGGEGGGALTHFEQQPKLQRTYGELHTRKILHTITLNISVCKTFANTTLLSLLTDFNFSFHLRF